MSFCSFFLLPTYPLLFISWSFYIFLLYPQKAFPSVSSKLLIQYSVLTSLILLPPMWIFMILLQFYSLLAIPNYIIQLLFYLGSLSLQCTLFSSQLILLITFFSCFISIVSCSSPLTMSHDILKFSSEFCTDHF